MGVFENVVKYIVNYKTLIRISFEKWVLRQNINSFKKLDEKCVFNYRINESNVIVFFFSLANMKFKLKP